MWFLSAIAAVPPSLEPSEVVRYQVDGWSGELRHYAGSGPPVLLVHGLGTNHRNFDFRPEVSLAHHLQQADWDVWVFTLPLDDGPEPLDFELLSTHILPAAVDRVLARTGHASLYWVGHSMGGMLLYATLDPRIEAGVTVNSPGQFLHPTRLARWGSKARSRANGPRAAMRWAWTVPFNPVVGLVGNPRHLRNPVTRGLAHHAVHDTPAGIRAQVSSWVFSGELIGRSGPLVDFTDPTPLLLLGSGRDRLVNVEDVEITAQRFPAASFVELPRYGHIDPLLGDRAAEEVYPLILDWLAARRVSDL